MPALNTGAIVRKQGVKIFIRFFKGDTGQFALSGNLQTIFDNAQIFIIKKMNKIKKKNKIISG